MSKKIKFPLKLKNDFPARSLDELKQHFDLDKIVAYFLNGKLLTWLEDRYYDIEATAVRDIEKTDDRLHRKLADIFGIALSDSDYPIDIDEVTERNRRLSKLRQYTSDPAILEQIACVAFNQEDLGDLLDEGVQKIYLCDNSFTIPLSIENKTYIGLGKAVAVIRSNEKIDFDSKSLFFQDIQFDSSYQKVIDTEVIAPPKPPEDFFKLGKEAEDAGNYTSAIEFYLKALENGNNDALFRIGWCYNNIEDYVQAYSYYKKAADHGDSWAMNNLACLYFNGQGVSQNYAEGRAWLEKAVAAGNEHARYWMGRYILYGQFGYDQNYKGKIIICQAASNGNIDAMVFMSKNTYTNYSTICRFGKDINLCLTYTRMAAEAGHIDSMYNMSHFNYWINEENIVSISEMDRWLIKAAEVGHEQAMWSLARHYVNGKSWKSTIERDLHKAWFWAKKAILQYAINDHSYESMHTIREIYNGAPELRDDITTVLKPFNMLYALHNPDLL